MSHLNHTSFYCDLCGTALRHLPGTFNTARIESVRRGWTRIPTSAGKIIDRCRECSEQHRHPAPVSGDLRRVAATRR